MGYPEKVKIGDTDYYIPFADEIPFDAKQLSDLEEDIRATNEVEVPIVLCKEKSTPTTETVVDGIHRVLIAGKLGLARVPTEHRSFETEEDARTACRRLNVNRRHLTVDQLTEERQKRVARISQARAEGRSLREIAEKEKISLSQVQRDLSTAVPPSGEKPRPASGRVVGADGRSYPATRTHAKKASPGTKVYGDPIDFRGLRHAPVNEQGVVFLFGMVAQELDFLIEAVQGPYPDCEGKRKIKPGKWERVRIEFEFESRNFKVHCHEPDGCDVIVCWRDNWPEPERPPNLKVIELREVIKTLPSSTE